MDDDPLDIAAEAHSLEVALGRWPTFAATKDASGPEYVAVLEAYRAVNRRRLQETCWWEGRFPESFDHSPLIATVCQVVETELAGLVAEPLRAYREALLESFAPVARPGAMESLRGWLEGRLPTTMGSIGLTLEALGEGLRRQRPEFVEWVGREFDAPMLDRLHSGEAESALRAIRNRYRNPVAHGTQEFPKGLYADFCRRVFGAESVAEWFRSPSPARLPDPRDGVLQQFQLSRKGLDGRSKSASGSGVFARPEPFYALSKPPESGAYVSVEPFRVEFRTRALVPPLSDGFRLGDNVHFRVRCAPWAWAVLLCRTANGAAVLYPTRTRPYSPTAGDLVQPEPGSGEPPTVVQEPVGAEVLYAIATRVPLKIDLLSAKPGLRELTRDEMHGLEAALSAMPPGDWAFSRCEFTTRA